MDQRYENALREACAVELMMADWKLRGRRNIAIVVGLITAILISWAGWSLWLLILPGVVWFAAAGQHFHLTLIQNEVQRRKAEMEKEQAE